MQANMPATEVPTTGLTDSDADRRLSLLSSLLENLDEVGQSNASPRFKVEATFQNRLVQVRLGVASGLFLALRAKHPPTAAHGLRVALACSSWAVVLDMSDQQRDELEVAALLHDIGKIGVPDKILLKAGKHTAEETAVMNRHRQTAREILSACAASQEILDILWYASAWYDGRSPGFERAGEQLPLGARMLAIAEAFDSMTTDHVYRRGMSRERATAELFAGAGTQFDPGLIRHFAEYLRAQGEKLTQTVINRWLYDLRDRAGEDLWKLSIPARSGLNSVVQNLFQEQLLQNMHDGVVFVDVNLRILKWNQALELLTGIPAAAAEQQLWDPAIVQLRDEHYKLIPREKCPVLEAIRSGQGSKRRLFVSDAEQGKVSIDAQISPVIGSGGDVYGVALLLQDASSRITLEERVESLREKSTQDGLTGVANRAEFDRVHDEWVTMHLERGVPYSLIICDLDHFKKINDTYGHQAGDEALITFAALVKRFCRGSDLVARYGGEEFVVLCPDCDNATATARAEAVREALAAKPQPMLDGKCITASFGVTELQPGDTAETMLRRADRALLQAKSDGRNTVVQFGSGMDSQVPAFVRRRRGWLSWLREPPGKLVLNRKVITPVPLRLVVEKLRGFIADNNAQVDQVSENRVVIELDGLHDPLLRRSSDRPTPFLIELEFSETGADPHSHAVSRERTLVSVTIRPRRQRDRRQRDVDERARRLLASLKSYLMAQDYDLPAQ